MKFRFIIIRGGLLTTALLCLLAGSVYCWTNSWRWGSTPRPHASFSPEEIAVLTAFDSYLLNEGAEQFQQAMHTYLTEMEEEANSSIILDQLLKLEVAFELRCKVGNTRRDLFALLETGRAENCGIDFVTQAVRRHDVSLIKLIVQKGIDPAMQLSATSLRSLLLTAPDISGEMLPAMERVSLLSWLHERGGDFNGEEPEALLKSLEFSIVSSDDDGAYVLDWLLRHGYARLTTKDTVKLLLLTPASMETMEGLIQDGLLPRPQREWADADMLSSVVRRFSVTNPDALRWLIEQGVNVNDNLNQDNEPFPSTALDTTLWWLEYAQRGISEEMDSVIDKRIEILEILLECGARTTDETKSLLPYNDGLKSEIVARFRKHGIEILAGEAPCNACCEPE